MFKRGRVWFRCRMWLFGLGWIVLSFSASACAPEKSKRPEVLRIGMMDAPETLDPHRRNAFGTSNIIGQMYESLVSYDRNLGLVPGLAESWENPEENRWRFHIRKNVRFHNGKVLDAYDVEATLRRLRSNPDLENANYVSHVTDVDVLSPQEIEITTSRLSISTLNRLLYVYIVPKDYSQCEENWESGSCGTGPYQLAQWRSDRLSLRYFPDYWSRKPAYESVEYHYYTNTSQILEALDRVPLQCAKLDGTPIPPEISRNFRIESLESLYVIYLGVNLSRPQMLLTTQENRALLDKSIDRQRLVDEARYGHATITVQMVPPYVYGFDPSVKLTAFRKTEFKFPPHAAMTVLVRQIFEPVGRALQRQFLGLGLRTEIVVLPDSQFFARLRAGDYDLFLSRWGCVTTDASELFENCFYTKGVREGYGINNYTFYGSPDSDQQIDDSGISANPQQRIKLLQSVMSRISNERVWIPLYINHDVYAISNDVDWQPRLDSRLNAAEFNPN